MAVPCGFQYELPDGSFSELRADCDWDKKAAMDYLGTSGLLIYYNEGIFNLHSFDDHRITKQSNFKTITANPNQSTYTPFFLEQYILQDEIEFIQWGQNDEVTYEKLRSEASQPSFFSSWPTKENPRQLYKFSSMWLELD